MKKLFVSYRHDSWPFAHRLAQALGAWIEADIFVDFSHIDQTNFEASILTNLRSSDAVLVILTDLTFAQDRIHKADDWVRREIREALTLDKPIVLASDGEVGRYMALDVPDDIRAIKGKQSHNFYPEFFEAGVERLARFIAKATPIPLRAVPKAVTVDAPPPPSIVATAAAVPAPTPKTPQALFGEASALLADGKYEDAIFLLENLMANGFRPKVGNIQVRLDEAKALRAAELRQQEADSIYTELAALVRAAERSPRLQEEARSAIASFRRDYPDYGDPQHLYVTVFLQAPTVLKVTPEHKRLLNIMLDVKRPPQERAQAGDELAKIGDPRPGVGLDAKGLPLFDWITIPAGDFLMGDNKQRAKIDKPYRISRYPVTYAQYKAFLDAKDGYPDTQWWEGLHADALKADNRPGNQQRWRIANRPAENLCWYEAMAFCRWATWKYVGAGFIWPDTEIRLPTEEEWERAARGTDGRSYPWGNDYISAYANINETTNPVGPHYLQQTTAVGIYPQGASSDGVLDMSGNVLEWVLTEYKSRKSTDFTNIETRVLRGGSWASYVVVARAAVRDFGYPDFRFSSAGLRVVAAPIS